jgi:antitoxin (DNA-binding transcriptional repressor) of toxin-antitoxin stability system
MYCSFKLWVFGSGFSQILGFRKLCCQSRYEKTGEWVRKSEKLGVITVTDRGKAVARIVPVEAASTINMFSARKLRRGYARMLGSLNRGTDSTQLVSADRDRT